MKYKRTKYYCMIPECGWEEINHKCLDGLKCPKCGGPTLVEPAPIKKITKS